MLTAIVGTNWGDEGKGRMVDLLSESYDIVCRYQGGNNAGHTVINEKGKFILNLLPSGILRDETVNVLGAGMVVDAEHLFNEINSLKQAGIEITPKHLVISDKATICMPYHKLLDCLEEDRLDKNKFGSTRRGIAPSYADKYMKKTFRFGDLLYCDNLKEKVKNILEWKNLTVVGGYKHEAISEDEIYNWLMDFAMPFKDYVKDTGEYLSEAISSGKKVMFEAQLGSLRDIDFGIFPFTSSSSTIAAYAPIGAGVPQYQLDECIGIMKAYSSCVGAGPFVCELFDEEGHNLREAGGEYGAATGRPRRVGGFDVVASRYGATVQGCTYLALTKLDVLNNYEKIPVCVAYEVDGKRVDKFVFGDKLNKAKPIYEYFDGWNCDICGCRKKEELPQKALDYISYIEKAVGFKIKYVSVGPKRDEIIEMF